MIKFLLRLLLPLLFGLPVITVAQTTGYLLVNIDGTFRLPTGSTVSMGTLLKDSATLNFDLTALSYQDLNITVTGAAIGDVVAIGVPNGAVVLDLTYFGWVSGTNTVSIRCSRVGGGGATDPPSGNFKAIVFK